MVIEYRTLCDRGGKGKADLELCFGSCFSHLHIRMVHSQHDID